MTRFATVLAVLMTATLSRAQEPSKPARAPKPVLCAAADFHVVKATDGKVFGICQPDGKRPVIFSSWTDTLALEGVKFVAGVK